MTTPTPVHSSTGQQKSGIVALAVVTTAYALSFFHRFAPAVIAQDLAASFQTSAASLGMLAATYFYVYTLMQIPTGILVDTLGPRRILLLGGIVAGLGSILFGLSESLQAALIGRTIVGLGVSVTFIALLKIIALTFEERQFATLVGACILVGNLGSVLAGAPLTYLAQQSGWRSAFWGAGLLSLLLGIACWVLLRENPANGLPATAARPTVDRTIIWRNLLAVLRNRASWPATLVNAGVAGSFFAFGGLWALPFLSQVYAMSRATASVHLSLYFAGFAVGCLLVGILSDRLGTRKPVAIIAAHLYCAIWLFWLTGITLPLFGTYALFALMGLCAACFVLTWACAKEVNPPLLSGLSTSVTNMGGFLATALLQPLVGYVIDLHWYGTMADGVRIYSAEDLRLGMIVLAVAALFGAANTWRLTETGCRNIWRAP
jgi:predicted MFS family arabinose efflux permease